MIELQDDRGRNEQTQIQIENERNDLQQLMEQEEAIRKLEVNNLVFFFSRLSSLSFILWSQ